MYKKSISIIMVIILTLSLGITTASAQEISIFSIYTDICSSALTISGTTATCSSRATGYLGITTKITIDQTLQKKTASGWSNVDSWSETVTGHKGSAVNTKTSLSSGTYRLKSVFTVYSGTDYEVLEKASSEKII